MVEHRDEDLAGSRFERVDMRGSRFEQVNFDGVFLRNVYFADVRLRGVWLKDMDVDGVVDGLTINGVDVGPLIEAELERRDPRRRLLHPTDADGFRAAWDMVVQAWEPTLERARALPESALRERVDTEWSFLETLRHLVFCADAWVLRAVLGQPSPYWPGGVLHAEHDKVAHPVAIDHDADPGLDEVLAARAERHAVVSQVMAELTDDQLAGTTTPVPEPGYPPSEAYPVPRCLGAVVQEEWLHREYAERDLAVLEADGLSPT